MMEAFWSRMPVELLNTRGWKNRVELGNAISEYIEIFHNRRRRHSSLGMQTPVEYELLHTTRAAARVKQSGSTEAGTARGPRETWSGSAGAFSTPETGAPYDAR